MTFRVTKRAKKRARRRRMQRENKWKIWRIVKNICFILSVYCFVQGVLIFDEYDPRGRFYGILGFSISLITYVVIVSLMYNFTSGWIQERLNEHMWIQGNVLHHFWQVSFAAGLNYRNADLSGTEFQLDLTTVREVLYDAKSGRVEFYVSGCQVLYDDFTTKRIRQICPLVNSKYKHVCYDYYNPGLVDVLKSKGILCRETTMDFNIKQI